MASPDTPTSPGPIASRQLIVTVRIVYISGVVSIFGILFLVAFFATFINPLGIANDIAVIIQYTLMIPIALSLHQTLRPSGPALSRAALLVGIPGMLAVIVLQAVFVGGLLPYERYIFMVSAGFLVVLGWFLMVRHLGQESGFLPKSILLHILAGLYVGYPFWAFSVARRLRSRNIAGLPLE
jgi:hypothetical protein